jgi:hypothetical protein
MPSAIKLTEQELKAIEDIKLRKDAIKEEIADIGLSKINLKIRKEKLEEFYTKTLSNETQIAKVLEDKYGKGSIDVKTGTFTPLQ